MFDPFAHFLAYGATDQRTLRDLTDAYDGLIVPGTIAAFQAEGTKGFVLTLSASDQTPYAIDPRFPLFQTLPAATKKSHGLLAQIFGIKPLVDDEGWVRPDAWTPMLAETIATSWIEFNTGYSQNLQPKAFDKYARRLGHAIPAANRPAGPTWILPPYLVVDGDYRGAAAANMAIWESSITAATAVGARSQLRRVFAVAQPEALPAYVATSPEQEVVVWVSGLDEVDTRNADRLAGYATAVRRLGADGRRPFALYGGYFAVTLRALGLTGASHGVGFSEYRNHIELKSSGAAPARFYISRVHRYFPRDLASELWRRDPELVDGLYPGYVDRDPQEYDYHELMRHSVLARAAEIQRTAAFTALDHIADLQRAGRDYRDRLQRIRLTAGLRTRTEVLLQHLPVWVGALTAANRF